MDCAPFDVDVEVGDTEVTIRLQGELDFWSTAMLDSAIRDIAAREAVHIVLDFANLTFLDSEGVKLLLTLRKKVSRGNGSLEIIGCRPDVGRIFQLLGLSEELCVQIADAHW